jgi:transcriptional regulator with XRE-family HTH domain
MLEVITEGQRKVRLLDIEEEKRREQEENEEARKNHHFTQTYDLGWDRIVQLAKECPQAVELYAFFARNLDPTCGAVVADQQFLADRMGVSRRTISTWLKQLEEHSALVRIPVAGKVCAYALNPYEVWKGYNNGKEYAAFNTKTLVNHDGDIKRRIMSMFDGKESDRQKKVPTTPN